MKFNWTVAILVVVTMFTFAGLIIRSVLLKTTREENRRTRMRKAEKRQGDGLCQECKGKGCFICKNTGKCKFCGGKGIRRFKNCLECANNYWFIKTGRDG